MYTTIMLEELKLLALNRPEISSLYKKLSNLTVYVFQWTAESEVGWAVTENDLDYYEGKECTTWLTSNPDKLFKNKDGKTLTEICFLKESNIPAN